MSVAHTLVTTRPSAQRAARRRVALSVPNTLKINGNFGRENIMREANNLRDLEVPLLLPAFASTPARPTTCVYRKPYPDFSRNRIG